MGVDTLVPTAVERKAQRALRKVDAMVYAMRRKAGESDAHWHWRREVRGVARFLGTLESKRGLHGDVWVSKMLAHYETKLDELLNGEPGWMD